MSTVSDLAKILADLRAYHDSSIGEHAFETKCPGVGNCQVLTIMASLEEVMDSLVAVAAPQPPDMAAVPMRSPFRRQIVGCKHCGPYFPYGSKCPSTEAEMPGFHTGQLFYEDTGEEVPESTPATGKAHA